MANANLKVPCGAARVRVYAKQHPGIKPKDIAVALGISPSIVHSTMNRDKYHTPPKTLRAAHGTGKGAVAKREKELGIPRAKATHKKRGVYRTKKNAEVTKQLELKLEVPMRPQYDFQQHVSPTPPNMLGHEQKAVEPLGSPTPLGFFTRLKRGLSIIFGAS